MYTQAGVYMTKPFKVYVIVWSLFLLTVMCINFIRQRNTIMCYSLLSQQIVSWLVLVSYLIYSKFRPGSFKLSKTVHLVILALSGPILLVISIYSFVQKSKIQLEFYALSFITWWTLFTISVYCSFELALDVALYYHRKKKALYYDSIENSSPLIS